MAWESRPFDAIRAALTGEAGDITSPVRLDPNRWERTGAPEFILAERKPVDEVVASLERLAMAAGRATATRLRDDQFGLISTALGGRFAIEADRPARAVTIYVPGNERRTDGGKVGILTAGSSDYPVAAETAFIARELGCAVYLFRDVGVAGLHRLVEPLERLAKEGVHVIVAVAGMDGALPSVVAGLAPVPVIGLPISTGYGYGGDGAAALSTMLQSCSPGLVVVNIDNGVGAAVAAAKIARLAARE
jgi:NCAIR mutase (PurE)-related protein